LRTIFRLCLAAAIAAAIGLVAVPVASANTGAIGQASVTKFEKKQNKRIKKAKKKAARAHERIEALKSWNNDLDAHNRRQDGALNTVQGLVNTILEGVPGIIGALTDINAALQDPVTGLLGLNLARPQIGAFDPAGTFLSGTSSAGGAGPDDDADVSGSIYVIDFNNDVSSRVYSVNVFPAGPGVAPPISSVGSCETAGIDALCEGIKTDSGGDPNQIVVQFGNGAAPSAVPFTVTAISG
jgi:hypothetical protein